MKPVSQGEAILIAKNGKKKPGQPAGKAQGIRPGKSLSLLKICS
jgi:hypothetical protein